MIVSRGIGELIQLNIYMSVLATIEILRFYGKQVNIFWKTRKGKTKALDSMKVPNLENAKVIYSYLLEFKKAFDRENHITMKTDLTGQGINVIK